MTEEVVLDVTLGNLNVFGVLIQRIQSRNLDYKVVFSKDKIKILSSMKTSLLKKNHFRNPNHIRNRIGSLWYHGKSYVRIDR